MGIFKRLSAFAGALLLSIGLSNAASYHVRTDGDDGTCNGTANASAASAPNCAKLTIQAGLNLASCGDTVTVYSGTYAGAISMPLLNCTAGTRLVLRGDPSAATSAVIISGLITFPPVAGSLRGYQTIQHFKLARATSPMVTWNIPVDSGSSTNYWHHLTLSDLLVTSLPTNGGLQNDAIFNQNEDGGWGSTLGGHVFDSIRISNSDNANALVAVNAWSWYQSDTQFTNNTVEDLSGRIFYSSSQSGILFQNNIFRNISCNHINIEEGDGCIRGYNNVLTIDHNVFDGVSGNDEATSIIAVVTMRRTDVNSNPAASLTMTKNTFISKNPTAGANSYDAVVGSYFGLAPVLAKIQDNIFIQYGSSSSSTGAPIDWITNCPTAAARIIDHNFYYQSQNSGTVLDIYNGACGTSNNSYGTGDITSAQAINPFSGCVTPRTCAIPYTPTAGVVCTGASDGGAYGAKNCQSAQVTTYHVRTDGHDTNCNGTANASAASAPNCAFLTINKAITSVTGSGKTILVHTGTYTECNALLASHTYCGVILNATIAIPSTKSGAAGAYNVIKAANDGTVTLSGASTCGQAIAVEAPYWQVGGLGVGEGFTINGLYTLNNKAVGSCTGVGPVIVRTDSTNNGPAVDHIDILGNTLQGNTAGPVGGIDNSGEIVFVGGARTTVGSRVLNNSITLKEMGAGIQFSTGFPCGGPNNGSLSPNCDAPTAACPVSNFLVEGNSIIESDHTIRHAGLFAHGGSDIFVRRNYIEIGTAASPNNAADNYGMYQRGNCKWTSENNIIRMHSPQSPSAFFHVQDYAGSSDEQHRYFNNTVYGEAPLGFDVYAVQGGQWYNNVISGATSDDIVDPWVFCTIHSGSCSGATGDWGYNDTYNTTYPDPRDRLPFQTYWSDTLTVRGSNLTVNPQFGGGTSYPGALHLSANSTALTNTGCDRTTLCTSAPANDFDNDLRSVPRGDIGADEFSGAASTCGDGATTGGETCDDGNTVTETACPYGTASCTLCNADCSATLSLTGPRCGDGTVNGPNGVEDCDGAELNGHTCSEFNCAGGTPTCDSLCHITQTGCDTCTVIAPGPITNLQVAQSTRAPEIHATLTWLAPGANGNIGTATSYQIRTSNSVITSCTDGVATTNGLSAAGAYVSSVPAPQAAGTAETFTVIGLRPGATVYFAVCATNSGATQGPVSNVVQYNAPSYAGWGYSSVGGSFNGTAFPTFRVVTDLADTNTAGTLRNAIANLTDTAPGDYIVLNVSGVSTMATSISTLGKDYWTIDGSAAPTLGYSLKTTANLNDGFRLGNNTHVIITGMRFEGVLDNDDSFIVNNSSGVTRYVVIDNNTFYNVGRSTMSFYDVLQDATVTDNFFMQNVLTNTTGGTDTGQHARITWARNVFGETGERQPQIISLASGFVTDLESINNVHYKWGAAPNGGVTGTYAIRIRNNGGATPSTYPANVNIINDMFLDAAGGANASGIVYGATPGYDAEEGADLCAGKTQSTTTGLPAYCNQPQMGEVYVAGNYFQTAVVDSYSTVTSPRASSSTPVTVLTTGALKNSVMPGVGTYIRRAGETTLIDTITAAMPYCGDGVAQPGEACDGSDFFGATCASMGYQAGGTPSCRSDCSAIDALIGDGAGTCVAVGHRSKGTSEP